MANIVPTSATDDTLTALVSELMNCVSRSYQLRKPVRQSLRDQLAATLKVYAAQMQPKRSEPPRRRMNLHLWN